MKLVAIMLSLISVSYALQNLCRGDYLTKIHEKCLLANGGDRVVIDDLLEFKPANDKNGKCFRECILRECEYFGSDGKFKHDVPKRVSMELHGGNESKMKPIEEAAAKCVASQTYVDSNCENSEIFVRCLQQQSPVKLQVF